MIKKKETVMNKIRESRNVLDLRVNIWNKTLFADEEVSTELVKRYPYEMEYIPKENRTRNVCKTALLSMRDANRGGCEPYMYIPEDVWDKELALIAAKKWPQSLRYIPEKLRSKEVCLESIIETPSDTEYTPAEYFADDLFLHRALTESYYDYQFLSYLPTDTEEHKAVLVKAAFAAVKIYGAKAMRSLPVDILLDAFKSKYNEKDYESNPHPIYMTFAKHRDFEAWIRNSGYYKAEITKVENGIYRMHSRYVRQRIDAYFRVEEDFQTK